MSKTVLNRLIPTFLLVSSFLIISCQDRNYFDPNATNPDPDYVGDEASTLDFATSRSVKLDLNYQVGNGFASKFSLYAEYPLASDGSLRADLTPVASGIHVEGISKLSRTLPSYIKEVYAYSPNLFVPMLSFAKIENGVAAFEALDVEIAATPETRAEGVDNFASGAIAKHLKEKSHFYMKSENGNLKYDLIESDINPIVIPTEVQKAISSAFPSGKIADEKYYKEATIKIQRGKDSETGAKVYITPLAASARNANSFSYFVYEGEKELKDLTKAEKEKLETINILQYASPTTNSFKKNVGVTPGRYVQLLYKNKEGKYVEEFPVGAQIGWILHANAFDAGTFSVKTTAVRLCSVADWNSPNRKTNVAGVYSNNYNIFFSATANDGTIFNCFGFEDDFNKSGDGDCNDLIFQVLTDPIDAITPPPSITEEDITTTETKKGILAFEDQWPSVGDYDLNDVVVKYTSTINYLQKVQKSGETGETLEESDVYVTKVEDTFSFIHTGADYNNAFSYKVNVASSAVEKVTITDENKETDVDYTTQITTDGEGFVINLCPNVKDVIVAKEPVTEPQNYTVVIEFKESTVLQDAFATVAAPYNPFISPREKAGVEVHLPMYPPTSNANESLFGTDADRSDKVDSWYVSGENNKYPFAIHLADAEEFNIPVEREKIYTTYPDYLKWVESGMTDFNDWYK